MCGYGKGLRRPLWGREGGGGMGRAGTGLPSGGAVEGSRRPSRGCYVKSVWRPKAGESEDVAAGVQATLGRQR